jgi:acylphosphatase
MMRAVKAAQLLIRGIVQGVGYRYWAQRTARELGLAGWTRNLYDGRVEIFAEGDEAKLEELERRCKQGPRSAEVEAVTRTDKPPRGGRSFEIAPDAESPE